MRSAPLKIVATWDAPATAPVEGVEIVRSPERDGMLREIADADAAWVGAFDAELLAAAARLRWVQAHGGGVEGYLFPEFVASPVAFTCLKGIFDVAGAEHALAGMLAFARNLHYDVRQRWQREFKYQEPTDLAGKTLAIVGLGSIGLELARKAQRLDMRVMASTRRPRDSAPHVERLFDAEDLHELLAIADFAAIAVPTTAQTRGLIGEAELRAMKSTAYLIDVSGREAIYDMDALVRALREGWIAGATLQISIPPEDSPLWELDNFIHSFHRATSVQENERALELFRQNVERFRDGEPLLSVVDKQAGY